MYNKYHNIYINCFPYLRYMLQYYKYPLKVWLTSSLLGTILFIPYSQWIKPTSYPLDSIEIFLVTVILSALFSIPCWLLLWMAYTFASNHIKKPLYLKLLIILSTQAMLVGLMYLLGLLAAGQIIVPFSLSLLISTVVFSVSSDMGTSKQTLSKI